MKHLEGKTVWLEPRGDTTRYITTLKKATVVKVARVNITIQVDDRGDEATYRMHGNNLIKRPCFDSYIVHESVEDYNNIVKARGLATRLFDHFQWEVSWTALGLDKLLRIKEIFEE